jgi:hypothetical protein
VDAKGPSYIMGTIKLLLAILLAAGVYALVAIQANSYWDAAGKQVSAQAKTSAGHQIPGTEKDFEKALDGMKDTNNLLINWAIVLLGGTIGIAILAKGAKIRDKSWGLVLIPLTWVVIASSLANASNFKGALTYQLAHGQYVFWRLNVYLFLQMYFFEWSIVALIVLATWYLFFRFALLEDRTGADNGKS